jgi:transcriptional regulator with XRE-family HTH domain
MTSTSTIVDLRELRVALAKRGMPQWRLAAELGISPSSFSAYLRGRAEPPSDLRRRIAVVLGVDAAVLAAT